jgi:hypothetical protein
MRAGRWTRDETARADVFFINIQPGKIKVVAVAVEMVYSLFATTKNRHNIATATAMIITYIYIPNNRIFILFSRPPPR